MDSLHKVLGIVLLVFTFACEDILEVPDITGEEVRLLAPVNSAVVTRSNVTFSWDEVVEATQYKVQVASPNFENAAQIVLDSIVVVDSTFVGSNITTVLGDNAYEWRIKAQNSDYETLFSTGSFSVDTSGN